MSKKTFLILTCLVVALTCIIVAVRLADTNLPGNSVLEYNTYATQKAWADGSIRQNEILLLKSISRSNGNTTAEFAVYAMPAGSSSTTYMGLKASEVTQESSLSLMGTATCIFVGDQLSSITGLSVVYMR